MNTREKLTIILLFLGIILAMLPLTGNRSFTGNPQEVLSLVLDEDASFSTVQVARFIVSEDSTVQLIDVRPPSEFRNETLPSAINIPYSELAGSDPDKYLNNKSVRNIFISENDFESSLAVTYARGLGYSNTYFMKGGISAWIKTIMESEFSGERISARENALFETRTKAARLFTELNTLPDSMKIKFMESKKFSAKKLDGGCE